MPPHRQTRSPKIPEIPALFSPREKVGTARAAFAKVWEAVWGREETFLRNPPGYADPHCVHRWNE